LALYVTETAYKAGEEIVAQNAAPRSMSFILAGSVVGLALFTTKGVELELRVGTSHHVIIVRRNTVQLMTAGRVHVTNL
jgi:hypothetical protein